MDHQTEKTLHHAAHVVLHSETGRQALTTVGQTLIAVGAPLLATPAAPLVVGGAAMFGAYVGFRKLIKLLNS